MNPIDIGQRIYSIRKQNYHSRDNFAAALKTSDGNIKRIESGAGLPSLDLLVRMSILLGVSTDHLLFGVEEPASEFIATQIQRLYLNLSGPGQVALVNMGQELFNLEQKLNEKA